MRGDRASAVAAALVLAMAPASVAAERYVTAAVNSDGQLRIVTTDGRAITIEREGEQVGFAQIAISSDGATVGWVSVHNNCCTSYPIPRRLVTFRAGERRAFGGNELPVWRWMFTNGGTRVAFQQETVHGGLGVHYELRDVASGRLIAMYEPKYDANFRVLPNQARPRWVQALDGLP